MFNQYETSLGLLNIHHYNSIYNILRKIEHKFSILTFCKDINAAYNSIFTCMVRIDESIDQPKTLQRVTLPEFNSPQQQHVVDRTCQLVASRNNAKHLMNISMKEAL